MLPTSSRTFLRRQERSIGDCSDQRISFLPECDARSHGAPARKPTVRVTPKIQLEPSSRGRQNLRLSGDGCVVCCARVAGLDKEELRDHRRRRAALALTACGRGPAAGRERAARQVQGRDQQRHVPRLPAAGPAHPPGDRGAQHGHQDDPEPGGDDLQRDLRLPGPQGRGHERAGVRAGPQPALPGQPVAADLDRRPTPGSVPVQLPATAAPGACVTAYSNTWALGHSWRPASTATLRLGGDRRLSRAGTWSPGQVAAGLNGNAKAVLADGSQPGGTFAGRTSASKPQQSYVNSAGKIVGQSSRASAGAAARSTRCSTRPRC